MCCETLRRFRERDVVSVHTEVLYVNIKATMIPKILPFFFFFPWGKSTAMSNLSIHPKSQVISVEVESERICASFLIFSRRLNSNQTRAFSLTPPQVTSRPLRLWRTIAVKLSIKKTNYHVTLSSLIKRKPVGAFPLLELVKEKQPQTEINKQRTVSQSLTRGGGERKHNPNPTNSKNPE